MIIIKITPEKYIQLFVFHPDSRMYLSGWDYRFKYFLGIIPYIEYTKKLKI